MRHEAAAFLRDADHAAGLAQDFVQGRTRDDMATDALLRSGVERQLQIVGEALSQLARLDDELASKIPDLSDIVGLRNILVHGYAKVNLDRLWRVLHEDVPTLRLQLQALLREVSELRFWAALQRRHIGSMSVSTMYSRAAVVWGKPPSRRSLCS